MNARMAIKLTALGLLILAVFQLLRGHDILTGIAVMLLFLFAVAKIVAAIVVHRRGRGFPPNDFGPDSSNRPVPRPPSGQPPVLSAAAELKHESAG